MLAAPMDAGGRVVRLSDFEFEPGIPTTEILEEVRADAYDAAVQFLHRRDPSLDTADDETRWAAYDADADRVVSEVLRYYFGVGTHPSVEAGNRLVEVQPNNGDWDLDSPLAVETDCPHGCEVEQVEDACPHGWLSAARTAGAL